MNKNNNKKVKNKDLRKTQKINLKELKTKARESKLLNKIGQKSSKAIRTEAKRIRKANKKPNGEINLKNKNGNIIDVDSLHKTYLRGTQSFKALNDVNLSIRDGEFAVILGASGSGKTTLLNILSGLDRPTSGDVVVKNTNISALTNRNLTTFRRNHVGFVFQSYNLLLELNAKDNARLGQKLQNNPKKRIDLDELFAKVDLADKSTNSINELSGGQLQRVSIIRALSKNPSIIFADEPTGALDTHTSQKVIQLFKDINKKYGTTIVFVTHDESIKSIADRLIYVRDGRVNVQTK